MNPRPCAIIARIGELCGLGARRVRSAGPAMRASPVPSLPASLLASLLACLLAAVLAGCAAPPEPPEEVRPEPMTPKDLAKGDIATVLDIHLERTLYYLRELTIKLYRRNPSQWRRTDKPSAEFVVEQIFAEPRVPDFAELAGARGVDAIRLAFHEDYAGDRVLALMAGLTDMLRASYDNRTEFYLFQDLDPQSLYNSARNVETAAWLLGNERGPDGRLYLLSNSREGEPRNLSYERLFGKIIAQQDTLARIAATRQQRQIRFVVHRVAGAVFFPI